MRVCVHTHIIPGPYCRSRICLMPKHGYPSDLFLVLVSPCALRRRLQSAAPGSQIFQKFRPHTRTRRCSCFTLVVWKTQYVCLVISTVHNIYAPTLYIQSGLECCSHTFEIFVV